jgi:hypothetical protein
MGSLGWCWKSFPTVSAFNINNQWKNIHAFIAVKTDDTVVAYGNEESGGIVPSGLANVKTIYSGVHAVAALHHDGTVSCFGNENKGGNCPHMINVVSIYNTELGGFAALHNDGTVTCYGDILNGGLNPNNPTLTNVIDIYNTVGAFVAHKNDNSIQCWGDTLLGGVCPADVTNVKSIYSNSYAFVIIRLDNSVFAFGHSENGGSGVPTNLSGVQSISATSSAFAALKSNGDVFVWGNINSGGRFTLATPVVTSINSIVSIHSTWHAFSAIKTDRSVYAWGNQDEGGKIPPSGLTNVQTISSSGKAFAALLMDGTVVTYGNNENGGTSPAGLTNVVHITSTIHSFAALKYDGTVISWGGDITSTPTLSNVISIHGTGYAFAAMKADKSVVLWGNALNGGSSSSNIEGIKLLFGTQYYRSISIFPHLYNMCPKGKYSIAKIKNTNNCNLCKLGYSTITFGTFGTSSAVCNICAAGYTGTSINGENGCIKCDAGKYSPPGNGITCIDCEKGKYASSTGADTTECTSCAVGYTTENSGTIDNGQIVCNKCSQGYFSVDGNAYNKNKGCILEYFQESSKHVISTIDTGTRTIFAIDLDKDGDIDLISASSNSVGSVQWYRNDGLNQGFTRFVLTSCNTPHSVFGIDFDSDGDNDIIITCRGSDAIHWLENDGSETFTQHDITSAGNMANDVFTTFPCDLDGDGDIDIIASLKADNVVAWFENKSITNEGFVKHIIDNNADNVLWVSAIDLDHDGDLDILSATIDSGIAWHENNGNQVFSKHTITSAYNGASSILGVDYDRDGDYDIVVTYETDDIVALYENDSNQQFIEHVIGTLDHPQQVVASDIDGDGDPDLIVVYKNADTVIWYENAGNNQFYSHILTTSLDGPFALFAIDFDHDGDVDIAVASSADNTISWFENLKPKLASATFSDGMVIGTGRNIRVVHAADVNGNGAMDIVSADGFKNIVLHGNNGNGDFRTIGSSNLLYNANLDLAWSKGYNKNVVWNNIDPPIGVTVDGSLGRIGTGTNVVSFDEDRGSYSYWYSYSNFAPMEKGVEYTSSIYVKANKDFVYMNTYTCDNVEIGRNFLFHQLLVKDEWNRLEWKFLNPLNSQCESLSYQFVFHSAEDVHFSLAAPQLEKGSSATSYKPTFNINLVNKNEIIEYAIDVYSCDLDNDGDLDLIAAGYNDNSIMWYENLGTNQGFNSHTISTGSIWAYAVYCEDINNDGMNDVISASFGDGKVVWYENKLKSNQGFVPHIIDASGARGLYAADVDSDGDIDIIVASYNDHSIRWYENTLLNGARIFTTHTITTGTIANGGKAVNARTVYAIDLNRDGNIDILSNSGSGYLYWYENSGSTPPVFIPHEISTTL